MGVVKSEAIEFGTTRIATDALASGTANNTTYLRGDQTWASIVGLTDGDKGDITVSASGATWTIDNGVVSLAKIVNINTDRLLGRDTAASGVVEELTVGGGIEFTGSGGIQRSALTGDVTASAGSATTTIANDAVTYAKMQNASAGNVVLTRAAATSGDYGETGLAASQLLGRGSTGDVAAISLGSGLSMSGTTLSAPAGSSPVVYVAGAADPAINSLTDITIVTRDVTGVGTTDKLTVETEFTILNNSGATRVYTITLDFDGLFDVEFQTGALATSATLIHPFYMRGTLDIRSTSLAYGVFTIEGQLAAGIASGTDTTMAATHLRGMGWGTTTSNASGTTTCALFIRSASATATQTCRLHKFVISEYTPT